jgi:hypothetical protein
MLNFKKYLELEESFRNLRVGDVLKSLNKTRKRGACGNKPCSRLNAGEYVWQEEPTDLLGKEDIKKINLIDKRIICYYNNKNENIILEIPKNQFNINMANDFVKINKMDILINIGKDESHKIEYIDAKDIKNKVFVYYKLTL